MEDMISRKAAIDALNVGAELLRRVLDDADIVGAERAKYEWGLGLIESYISDMKELPPAQPETHDKRTETHACDCISRQAAIDALDMAIERYDEMAEEYRKKADIERNDYMDMRDNAYEAQQLAQWLNELKYLREKIEQITIKPEPHWISCSERLPEHRLYVLVTYKYEYGLIDNGITWYSETENKWNTSREVITWMPLPEPYAERRTDESDANP